jgi:hypothetical protein
MMYDRFSYLKTTSRPKAVLGVFILSCLTLPFLSLGTGCGSGGGETTGTSGSTNTTDGGGNTSSGGGGRAPAGSEKPGYLGRLVDNGTGQGISGAVFVIGNQRIVTNAQGFFNAEFPNGSGEIEAFLEVARYQSYVKNANIRSLDTSGKSLTGCTNNKRFFVPAVARGLVWDLGNFALYADNSDAVPAGPCGL